MIGSARGAWRAVLALLTLVAAQPALAWGGAGHDAIAAIATANIRPATAARIRDLVKADPQLGTRDCRVRSLKEASSWPDCLRVDAWRWGYTFPWHFQDMNVCAAFDIKANCADGNCVTAQIERNRRILADASLPRVQRLEALAFLVHFVGDIHQPLHGAEFDHDAGGNRETVINGKPEPYILPTSNQPKVVNATPKPPTLHWFWDKWMAERALAANPGLVRRYAAADRARIATGTPADWLKESWEAARAIVYTGAYGRDPCDGPLKPELTIDEATAQAAAPLAAQRLQQAGLRLAKLLDETLAG
ncbi:MAG: S1/P1 nuclease [Sphingomonadales bacterium]|nr:S1/P1 nuclease [Sphingomonadales bacterium]